MQVNWSEYNTITIQNPSNSPLWNALAEIKPDFAFKKKKNKTKLTWECIICRI